jgi:hypothetical protein
MKRPLVYEKATVKIWGASQAIFPWMFICMLIFVNSIAEARSPILRTVQLRSTDGSAIDLSYAVENFSPNEMGGTSQLVKAMVVKVKNAQPFVTLRAVLVNHCSSPWMDKPVAKTYITDLRFDPIEQVFQGAFQEFVGSATGYRYDTSCHQEIAFVNDQGQWLKDPINGTSNFQFTLVSVGVEEDPLAKWADKNASVELAQAGAWKSCDQCQGISALIRVKISGGHKKVGLVYSTVSEYGQVLWHETMGKFVAPLSVDSELWEVQAEVKETRARRAEFAVFMQAEDNSRSWDNNCGANYFSNLALEHTQVILIQGHPSPCGQ